MQVFLDANAAAEFEGVIADCRFALADPGAGQRAYDAGHIPGAVRFDLNRHLSAAPGLHGGRHPLPAPADFAAHLARCGVGKKTPVLLYDDGQYLFAARAWWMMRALGYGPVHILSGGYPAWLGAGGAVDADPPRQQTEAVPPVPERWPYCCNREELAELMGGGAMLVDAREATRYRGEHEPIDPVAGHIPGAGNLPWQSLIDESGQFADPERLRELWGDRIEADPLVVYCGSGVSACVNLLSLAILGRDDAWLYGGSWSDWCSYLDPAT